MNAVLNDLLRDDAFVSNTIVISLNGLIHTDDRIALKSTTKQMNLEEEAEGKVFNSFSENLTFLLACLKGGKDKQRLIFIIDEFDLFCSHHNQTLLYNLFDVAQSAQAPICVLGLTCRFDVVELLEKRVKSRFSHRQIFLLPDANNYDEYVLTTRMLLKLPTRRETIGHLIKMGTVSQEVKKQFNLPFLRRAFDWQSYNIAEKEVTSWNKSVDALVKNEQLLKSLENYFNSNATIGFLKLLLIQEVSKLDDNHQRIDPFDFAKHIEHLLGDDSKVKLMIGLSVVEICILIAIKHHCKIYDNDPFNFEMILTRFNKFAVRSTTVQNIEREMILKRFENLKHQEFIVAVGVEGKVQKEYQMHRLLLLPEQIDSAIKRYQNLPTEIEQWAKSDIV